MIQTVTQTKIPVLYQDDDLIIVNKPFDVLSVPGKGPEKRDCLWHRMQEQGFPTARIVHRLDYATSGLMVLALHADSHKQMSRLFQERAISKSYQALIAGQPSADLGTIELPLRCDWDNRPLQIVDYEYGKHAITHWQILAREKEYVRVLLRPETGRSHQLRVHMQWLGHPIAGDRFYATGEALALSHRLCLHAQTLGFNHPYSGERIEITADCPF